VIVEKMFLLIFNVIGHLTSDTNH